MKVRLLDGAVLDCDPALERSGQAEHDGTLDLSVHLVRIDDDAAVDCADDALDLDHVVGHANLGHLRDDRAERFVHRDALVRPDLRRSPVALLGNEIEHAEMTRFALQQPTTELVRILTGFVGELVDEALDDERILRMTDAAPESERHARIVEDMRDVDVRKRIRLIDGALV